MTDPSIFFSIVVPTYNRANIISATIDSILAQTYKNFEVIIIDDGSTDNTGEVVRKYLAGNVHYYKKPNAERAAARNFGAQKAKGDYINWFDSDDIMFPDHLQEAANIIAQYNRPEIFAHSYEHRSSTGEILDTYTYSEDINQELCAGNPLGNSPVIVRQDIAHQNPFNEDRGLSGSEDYELWLRMAAQYKIYSSPKITLAVIFHEGNSTVTMSDPSQLITRYTKFIHYTTSNPAVIKLLGKQRNVFEMKTYLLLAVDLAINKHLKLSRTYLAEASRRSPSVVFERGFLAYMKYYIRHSLS